MRRLDYVVKTDEMPRLGVIVLQADERLEADFRRLIPGDAELFVTRVPSGLEVTPATLQEMETHIPAAAALLPQVRSYDCIGYGCTSGAAQIGPGRVAAQVRAGAAANAVTDPVSALVAACHALGIKRLALLSPDVEAVASRLRDVLAGQGLDTPVCGTVAEAEESRVARISPKSIYDAALTLAEQSDVEGIFMSCTNLDTLDIISPLESASGKPVLSSNQVLAWHICYLAGCVPAEIPALASLRTRRRAALQDRKTLLNP